MFSCSQVRMGWTWKHLGNSQSFFICCTLHIRPAVPDGYMCFSVTLFSVWHLHCVSVFFSVKMCVRCYIKYFSFQEGYSKCHIRFFKTMGKYWCPQNHALNKWISHMRFHGSVFFVRKTLHEIGSHPLRLDLLQIFFHKRSVHRVFPRDTAPHSHSSLVRHHKLYGNVIWEINMTWKNLGNGLEWEKWYILILKKPDSD